MNTIQPENQFERFCLVMLWKDVRCVEVHTQPGDLVSRSEIRTWQTPNGKQFITRHWKEGFYNVYYPTEKSQVDEVYREVFNFGDIKEGVIK